MKSWTKVLIAIGLSFMFLFTCVGYAAVSDTLSISGTATTTYPEGIYIIATEVQSVSDGTSVNAQELIYTSTVDSTVNLGYTTSGWQTTYGKVVYQFTVYNNTPYEYAYSGFDYIASLDGYNGNSVIGNGLSISVTDANGGTFTDDAIAPGGNVIFRATYTITKRSLANTDLRTLINYKFGVNVASVGGVALDAALVRFGEILNDTSEGGAYETLIDKIDDKYDGTDWKANYIGNVVDAHNEDTETINTLFDGKLSLTIDDTVTNVTVLIKRENIDNNTQTGDDYTATYGNKSTSASGCEMTLYMTTDPPKSGSPVVYAAVFTCDRNEDGSLGKWYLIGDKYVGTASIVGYEGAYTSGSFDTGTWRSTGRTTYTVSDDYSYTVSSGQSIGTVIQATDTAAINALQSLLTQAKDVLSGVYGNYGGSAIANLQAAYDSAARYCTVGSDGTVTVNRNTSRAHAVPLIKELNQALVPFADIIS